MAWATRYAELCVAPHDGRSAVRADWADEGWLGALIDSEEARDAALGNRLVDDASS